MSCNSKQSLFKNWIFENASFRSRYNFQQEVKTDDIDLKSSQKPVMKTVNGLVILCLQHSA